MTFSKYTGAAAKLMYYILWFCFSEDFFLLFLHLTGKKIKKRVRNTSVGMVLTCKCSWVSLLAFSPRPAP